MIKGDKMSNDTKPQKPAKTFFKKGDKSPEEVADKIADHFIGKIDEERAKKGLPPLPEE